MYRLASICTPPTMSCYSASVTQTHRDSSRSMMQPCDYYSSLLKSVLIEDCIVLKLKRNRNVCGATGRCFDRNSCARVVQLQWRFYQSLTNYSNFISHLPNFYTTFGAESKCRHSMTMQSLTNDSCCRWVQGFRQTPCRMVLTWSGPCVGTPTAATNPSINSLHDWPQWWRNGTSGLIID